MNVPGEIARLTDIATPDVGVVTLVAPAHLQGLGSVDAVARAKSELYEHLDPKAVAVINADDPVLMRVGMPLVRSRLLRFGKSAGCDARVLASDPTTNGVRVSLELDGKTITFELPLVGQHNAMNAAAAALAAWVVGVPPEAIARGLASVEVPGGRLRRVVVRARDILVLDDTYNANPHSMRAAFATLRDLAKGRRVAVLGEMRELGSEGPALHREVGRAAAESGIEWVLALGDLGVHIAEGAEKAGARAKAYASLEALLADLDAGLARGDSVLVKGSRGMRMERVVQHLSPASGGGGH
jgi:UDP-N-acetylmuramoyl-tripeptide--D-alanyl-D-alanine ligase